MKKFIEFFNEDTNKVETKVIEMAELVYVSSELINQLKNRIYSELSKTKEYYRFSTTNKNIFIIEVLRHKEYIIYKEENGELQSGCRFSQLYNNNLKKPIIQILKTYKFTNNYNTMKDLYSNIFYFFDKELKILSDSKNTKDSFGVYLKWFNNPTKYNIKEIDVFNIKTNKIVKTSTPENYWGDDSKRDYRMIFSFN